MYIPVATSFPASVPTIPACRMLSGGQMFANQLSDLLALQVENCKPDLRQFRQIVGNRCTRIERIGIIMK